MADFNPTELGRSLAKARFSRTRLPAASLMVPPDLAAATQAQAAFFRHRDTRVEGWKVGINPGFGAVSAPMSPLYGPADEVTVPWQAGMAIEIEIAVRLAIDLPAPRGRNYQRGDIVQAISSVHLGLEVVSSRIEEGNAAAYLLFHADLLGNAGYVVGMELPRSFIDEISPATLTVLADEAQLFSAAPKHPNGDPLAPLLAYANAPSDRLDGLRAGQIVTTGSLCGMPGLVQPSRVETLFAGKYPLVVNFSGDYSRKATLIDDERDAILDVLRARGLSCGPGDG